MTRVAAYPPAPDGAAQDGKPGVAPMADTGEDADGMARARRNARLSAAAKKGAAVRGRIRVGQEARGGELAIARVRRGEDRAAYLARMERERPEPGTVVIETFEQILARLRARLGEC